MRFTLRKMFGLVTLAAILTTFIMYLTIDYRKKMAIRADLQTLGAYSVRFGPGGSIQASFHDPVSSSKIVKYRDLTALDLKEAHVTEESLKNLSGLENVAILILSLSDVRDDHLQQLKEFHHIRHLRLAHTGLTDACVDAIIAVPGLESVDVSNSRITPSGVDRLRAARPALKVRDQ